MADMQRQGVTHDLGAPHLKQSWFLAKLCWLQAAHSQSPGLMLVLGSVKPSQPFSMKKRDLSWRLSPVGVASLALEGRSSVGCRLAAGVIAFCSLTNALASA